MNKLIFGYNGLTRTFLDQKGDDTGEDLGGGAGDDSADTSDDSASGADDDPDDSASESESEGDGSDSASDDDGDHELGQRAKKRIDKLLSRSKSAEARVEQLEKELETARKLGGDDGKTYLAAAEKSGILAGLMSKQEAEAFSDLETIPTVAKRYRRWLNSHDKGDELEIGDGKTMSYGDVVDRVEDLTERLEDLKDKYGERRKALQAEVKGLFELGVAAKKAGWTPTASKKTEKTTKPKTKPSAGPVRNSAARTTRLEEIDVTDGDSLEEYMIAMRRNKKKED